MAYYVHSKSSGKLFFFWCAFVAIIIIKIIHFPSLTVRPEIFAETGINFFYHAFHSSLWENITTLDSAYLPWFPRLIAVITVKFLHIITLYPFIVQWFSIAFIALSCGIIALPAFRVLITSDFARFLLAIAVSVIQDYDLNTFVNFTYYGVILAFLVFYIDIEKLQQKKFIATVVLLFLIFPSKPYFVIFAPFYFLSFLHAYYKKYKKTAILYFCTLIAFVIQALTMLLNRDFWLQRPGNITTSLNFFEILKKAGAYFISTYEKTFFGASPLALSHHIFLWLLILVICTLTIRAWRQKNMRVVHIFLASHTMAFLAILLSILTIDNIQTPSSLFDFPDILTNRRFFFSAILLFIGNSIIISSFFKNQHVQIGCILFFILTSGFFGIQRGNEFYTTKEISYSQWGFYNELVNDEHYCIPVNPYPWIMAYNCEYLLAPSTDQIQTTSQITSYYLSGTSTDLLNDELHAIILDQRTKQIPPDTTVTIIAYDRNHDLLGTAKQIIPSTFDYVYFLFDTPVHDVTSIEFFQENTDMPVSLVPRFIFMGKKI